MRKIELVVGQIYIYKDLGYRAGKIYSVEDEVADYLLTQHSPTGMRFKEHEPKRRGPKPKVAAAVSRLKQDLGTLAEPKIAGEAAPKASTKTSPPKLVTPVAEAGAEGSPPTAS